MTSRFALRPAAALSVLALLSAPALAAERLTVDAFEAMVTGKTIFYSQSGQPYGAEEYRRDRSVVWSFLGGECQRGTWSPGPDDAICFTYEGQEDSGPICWEFLDDGGKIRARVLGADPADDLTMVGHNRTPLTCTGPDVGV